MNHDLVHFLTDEQICNPTIPLGWELVAIGDIARRGDIYWDNTSKKWIICKYNFRISNSVVARRYCSTNQVTIE